MNDELIDEMTHIIRLLRNGCWWLIVAFSCWLMVGMWDDNWPLIITSAALVGFAVLAQRDLTLLLRKVVRSRHPSRL